MIGARAATAEVLVFLDSHVRTDPYWLEPLLARLVHVKQLTMDCNRSRNSYKNETCETAVGQRLVLSPVIYGLSIPDEIENIPVIGGFSWNFTFRWELMKEERKENQPPSSCGYFDQWKTPAISGGIFATWRQGFFELGGYDEEMDIWGGENIEISLRTWMCHGRLEIVPCSRVGHLYRPVHPYDFPKGKEFTVVRNQKRAALVWLTHKNKLETADVSDNEFDALHYLALFHTASPTASGVPSGSVKLRRRLAQELQCHDFTWYLEHIYPELQNEARLLSISKDNELWSELELEALIESDFS
ncbi:putative n-acetylgalactosaminyltransferase [Paragonimus heterotremus]|uniref:Putative n-acetylgalactosaminyltransferase n=1 Tax=Paragonimus heterotremus TaxID=100268 RepID=A0A8J4WSM8_9TREM|nr:putative n-acetylgalactosaminyltransferase [Paragonimus heterotremus]